MRGASRLSSRAHSEWNVDSQIPLHASPSTRFDALAHLAGGFVGERDREHLVRRRMAVADEVRDAVRDDARLPRARARQNQQRPIDAEHRFTLFRIEIFEEGHCGEDGSV